MEFCCAARRFTNGSKNMPSTVKHTVDESLCQEKVLRSLYLIRDNEKIPRIVETSLRDLAEFIDSVSNFDYVEDLVLKSAHEIILKSMAALYLNAAVQRHGSFILAKLMEGSERVRLDLEVLRVHKVILRIMESHREDFCIQAVGCSLVANMLRNSERLCKDLIQENAMDLILQTMENFACEEELQMPACQLLNQLIRSCDVQECEVFVRTGKCSLVVQIMKTHIDLGEIAQSVCQLLCKLASSEPACQRLSERQVFILVLDAMKKHSLLSDIQVAGCQFLCQLCKCQMLDGMLVMQGAGEIALCALRQHRKNASVQAGALSLLRTLTNAIKEDCEAIRSKHWLQDIYIAMATHGDQPEIQKLACECILQLIKCFPDLCEVVGDPDVCKDINRIPLHSSIMAAIMLHPDDLDVCQAACQSLSCFAKCSDTIQDAFICKGVHLSLQKLMQLHPDIAIMQQYCCEALRILCIGNTSRKELLITNNIFEEVSKCLFTFPGNPQVQQEAIGLIACWATDIPLVRHQCAAELIHLHILNSMRCFSSNIDLLEMAFEALGALSAAEEIPQLLVDAGVCEIIMLLMEKHELDDTIQQKASVLIQVFATFLSDKMCLLLAKRVTEAMCLHANNERVQIEGCVALHVIAQIDAGKSEALVNSYAHERLFHILQNFPPQSQVCDLASQCLWFLGCVRDLKPRMLLSACASGLVCGAECLIRVGADVNAGEGYNTPLCFACMNNQEEMVKYLLTQVVTDVQSALRLCLEMEHHNLVGILLQHLGLDKEAGSLVWSGLNLGAVHPDWITPALLGDNFVVPRKETHSSRWSELLDKGKESWHRRGELSSSITSFSGFLQDTESVMRVGLRPGQEAPISMESLRYKMDETIAEESNGSSVSGDNSKLYDNELTDVFLPRAESKSGASFPYSPYDPRVVSPYFRSSKVLLPRSANWSSSDDKPAGSQLQGFSPDEGQSSFFYYTSCTRCASFSEIEMGHKRRSWSDGEPTQRQNFDDAFYEVPDSDSDSLNSVEEMPRKSPRLANLSSSPLSPPFQMPNNTFLCNFTSFPRKLEKRSRSCGVISDVDNSMVGSVGSESTESKARLGSTSRTSPINRKRKTITCVNVPNAQVKHIDFSSNAIKDLQDLAKASHMLLLHLSNVEKLDLSHNNLKCFPSKLCEAMPRLRHVSLRHNELDGFPYHFLHNNHLSFLDLSHNNINVLHRPQSRTCTSITLEHLDLSYNSLEGFPERFHEILPGLSSLSLAGNKLESLPSSSVHLCRLKALDISNNKLKEIHEAFLCECYCLERLKASCNLLKSLPEMDATMFTKLWSVKVAQNLLINKSPFFIPRFLLSLQNLQLLDISNNGLTDLPEPMAWQSTQLKELNLSHNKIKKFPLKEGVENFANLERLNLSHNNLRRVPTGIGALTSLTSLNVSHNPNITSLPDEMGKLSNLFELQRDGLKLDLEDSILESKTKDLIGHLHSKLRNSVPYYRMKLVLVGMSGRGKTAIRNLLIKDRHAGDGSVTVREWNLRDPKARCNHCNKKCVNYTISVWDFKGQEDLYGLFQCMLTTRALYLAVYDVTKGPEEIANLKPWLLNIQAFAPDAPVILVGTHHDKVPRERNDALLKSMKDTAKKLCSNPGFPEIRGHIVLDAQHESPGVKMLRNKVTEVILRCKCVGHSLVGTQIPLNFVYLQEIFMEKAMFRRNTGLPVLRKAEVQQLMKERVVLMDEAEMSQAARFLHEAGVIVHLDDPVMQLCDLYFVDPEWLCHLIAKVVAPRDSKHNPITDGIIQRSDVQALVENDKGNVKLPTSMVPQFLRLLVRFGVMLPLSSNEFLIPTKLSSKCPSITLPGLGSDAIIKRQYEMTYIPTGFWPRLIARLLLFLKTLFCDKKHFSLMETERIEKSRTQYWCEGIYVHLPGDEFFCIVPSRVTNKNSMIEITVPNSKYGYRILGHLVDHMDALLEEWFPGLCGVDPVHGLPLVKRLVPCVVCEGQHAHFFTLDECIQESAFDEYIICPKSTESIPIQRVAPDVVFGDVDEHFLIGDYDLILDEIPENLLGNGAFGAVYRAKYRRSNEERMDEDDEDDEDLITNPKKTVAVKVFHSAQDSTPHRMLRQEMTFLHRLRHPSIISLVGACLRPSRALVLELAPLGSLSSQLKKEQLLSRGLQHRIAMQIAEGLAFLHKNNIVYRDLKPQNILIFSLSLGILVNAKIADYGIARYATLCGLTASEGTPGYRAPEVARGDIAYNKEADMYSYGMFLYELVTGGRKPFEDLRFRNEVDKAIVDGRALDPITSSGCPPWPDVTDVIAHLLDSRPEMRPTAEEVYERLGTAELLCLRRDVAVCKEQTVECMAVRHFMHKGSPKLELWMGSGLCGDNSAQVSWLNLTDRHTEGCQGTMLKDRRVKCMTAVHSDIVLVGTQSGRLWVFEAGYSMQHKCLHCLPRLPDAVLCLKHYVDTKNGFDLVLAGLANGHVAVYDAQNLKKPDLQPSLIDLRTADSVSTKIEKNSDVEQMTVDAKDSSGTQNKPSPVACMTVARRRVFCGFGNGVAVLQFKSDGKAEVERRWSVEDINRKLVLNIAVGNLVWVSTRDSTLVDTWEPAKVVYRGAVDCKAILERSGVTEATHDIRILSLLLQHSMRQLWIGLGSGHVILMNPSTKEPLRIIRRHMSAVRCMEACSGPAFGKPLSLVMTGGMGFIERPLGSQNKTNADFGHVLIWEADVRAQIDFLDSYKKKREEYVSSSQLSAGESRLGSTVDLMDKGYQSLLRRKSII